LRARATQAPFAESVSTQRTRRHRGHGGNPGRPEALNAFVLFVFLVSWWLKEASRPLWARKTTNK